MSDDLEKRMRELSDEDLLNIIDRDQDQHDQETLEAARQEAEARGGIEQLYENIEAEFPIDDTVNDQLLEEAKKRADRELLGGIFSDVRTLDDETLYEIQYYFITNAAGNATRVLDSIQKKLEVVDMPLKCRWGVAEVKTKKWISRVRRDFLIVDVDEFPNHHTYISIRDFGTFLDCIRILTVEPGFAKKLIAKKLVGDEEALSQPKNILKHQDLHSWKEAVSICFKQAIDELIEELGRKPSDVRSGAKTFLDIW